MSTPTEVTPPTETAGGESLRAEELARLDQLLSGARRLHYGAWWVALGMLIGRVVLPPVVLVPKVWLVLLGCSVLLAAGADKLLRLAHPWLARDPRRPPFAWFVLSGGEPSLAYATLWQLVPVLVAGLTTARLVAHGVEALTFVVVPPLLALLPRASDAYGTLVATRRDAAGEGVRLSAWLVAAGRWLMTGALAVFLVASLVAFLPGWFGRAWGVGLVAAAAFVGLWLGAALVELVHKPLDRFGARLGFVVWQSEIPAAEFVGKSVTYLLKVFATRYEALSLVDDPPGKLRYVSLLTSFDGDRVEVQAHLKYNPKRLFSAQRTWEKDAVLEAEIAKLEYALPGTRPRALTDPGALAAESRRRAVTGEAAVQKRAPQPPERPREGSGSGSGNSPGT